MSKWGWILFLLLFVAPYTSASADKLKVFRSLYSAQQYDEALRVLHEKLESDATDDLKAITYFGIGKTAYETGDDKQAQEAFKKALEHKTRLVDQVHYFLGMSLKRTGQLKVARAHLNKVVHYRPKSLKRYDARLGLGEIAVAQKKWGRARNHFRYLERRRRYQKDYPDIIYNLVKTELKRKRRWVACRWARKLYRRYPAHKLTKDWEIDLQRVKFDGKPLGCVASLKDQKKRIRNLQHNGQSQRARQEIEMLIKRSNKQNRYHADSVLARFLVNEGYVREALQILIPYFKTKKRDFGYQMLLAKASSRAEEFQTAIGSYYRAHRLTPRSRKGRRALFQGAFLSYQFKDYDGALRKYKEFQRKYPRSGLSRDSKWYTAWIQYLRGDYDGSTSKLKSLTRGRRWKRRNPKMTRKARYWIAMSHLKSGRLVEAKKSFEDLAGDPLANFYALTSAARLEGLKDVQEDRKLASQPVLIGPEEEEPKEEDAETETTVLVKDDSQEDEDEDVAAADPDGDDKKVVEDEQPIVTTFKDPRLAKRFERASDLESLGFFELARWELYAIERRTRNRDYLRALLEHYQRIGAYHRAAYIGEVHFAGERRRKDMEASRALWEFTYPEAHRRSVETFSRSFNVPEELIWAIMRTESHYRADARSPVGALGLMQIMPYTGDRVARLLKITAFETSGLLEPEMNIRLGARYLQRLSRKFNGNIALIAAGYNAGPHRVDRWLKTFGHLDMDEFVEHIPYLQTREYVKTVTRNFFVYKSLYGKTKKKRPLRWLANTIGLEVHDGNTAREDWSDIGI